MAFHFLGMLPLFVQLLLLLFVILRLPLLSVLLLHAADDITVAAVAESDSESESEVIYLVLFQTQETSAKTTSGRCRRGHLE